MWCFVLATIVAVVHCERKFLKCQKHIQTLILFAVLSLDGNKIVTATNKVRAEEANIGGSNIQAVVMRVLMCKCHALLCRFGMRNWRKSPRVGRSNAKMDTIRLLHTACIRAHVSISQRTNAQIRIRWREHLLPFGGCNGGAGGGRVARGAQRLGFHH